MHFFGQATVFSRKPKHGYTGLDYAHLRLRIYIMLSLRLG
jgi:hypothetical protein